MSEGDGRFPWRPDRVRVGTVGRAHGLDGTFAVEGQCGWFAFRPGSRVMLDGLPARVSRRAGTDGRPLVAVEGIDDRTAAEEARGAALELPRAGLPEPEPDSFFHFDLIGCLVVSEGRELGRIKAVEEGVANDVLVLDDEAETRLPFVQPVVPDVDIEGRRVEVVGGLL